MAETQLEILGKSLRHSLPSALNSLIARHLFALIVPK